MVTDKTRAGDRRGRAGTEASFPSSPVWGRRKLGTFGADVLALCAGREPGSCEGSEISPEK
ncbi:hypothetical protein [Streptomyces thioluteus]|uniref:hypothetical protein n=1 Tax=Streptomyces thioluteus TaxID=66431 RepID=UPI003CD0BA33